MGISLLPDYTVGIYKHVSLGNAPLPGLRQGISSASQAMLIKDNRGNQQAYLSPHTIRLKLQSKIQGLIAGSQHGRSHPWQGYVERPDGQGGSGLEGSPGTARASTPKTRVCLSYYFMTFTNSSDINRPPFSEENQLRALVNKSPGHNKSVSIQKPLSRLSSLPEKFIQTFTTTHMTVYSLPTTRGTGSLKHSRNVEPFEELKIIRIELVKGFIVEPILAAKFSYL